MIDCQTTQGERFKDARTVWNQYGNQSTKAVSDATGISTSIINALENETRSVGYEKVIALAKHYGVSVDWLSGFTNDPHPKRCAVDELGLSPKATTTIKAIATDSEIIQMFNEIIEQPLFLSLIASIIEYKELLRAIPLSDKEIELIADYWEEVFQKHPRLVDRVYYYNTDMAAKSCLFEMKELFADMVDRIADPSHMVKIRQDLFTNMADHLDDEYFELTRKNKQ